MPARTGPAAGPTVRHAYGAQLEQFGELTLPAGATAPLPVVVLLHGGFWRAHRTLDLMRPLVAPLVDAGLAVPATIRPRPVTSSAGDVDREVATVGSPVTDPDAAGIRNTCAIRGTVEIQVGR
jgi:hypothetical protein